MMAEEQDPPVLRELPGVIAEPLWVIPDQSV